VVRRTGTVDGTGIHIKMRDPIVMGATESRQIYREARSHKWSLGAMRVKRAPAPT
jgi:hypothetical protein